MSSLSKAQSERTLMTDMTEIPIVLPSKIGNQIQQLIDTGEYTSTSEIVLEALRDWNYKRNLKQHGLPILRRLWLQTCQSDAPGVPAEDILNRLEMNAQSVSHTPIIQAEVSPEIENDLNAIAESVAQGNQDDASSFFRDIREEFALISLEPRRYQLRPEIGEGARLAFVGPHVILFRIIGETVRIERCRLPWDRSYMTAPLQGPSSSMNGVDLNNSVGSTNIFTAMPGGVTRWQYFFSQIPNHHTRRSYVVAVQHFSYFCTEHGIKDLAQVETAHVAAFIQTELVRYNPSTVETRLSALRKVFDWMLLRKLISSNPALGVEGPRTRRTSRTLGKT